MALVLPILLLQLLERAAAASSSLPASLAVAAGVPACPCSDPALCRPITIQHRREVFGFSPGQGGPYERYTKEGWARGFVRDWV